MKHITYSKGHVFPCMRTYIQLEMLQVSEIHLYGRAKHLSKTN